MTNQVSIWCFGWKKKKSPLGQPSWDDAVSCQEGFRETLLIIISLTVSLLIPLPSTAWTPHLPTPTGRTLPAKLTCHLPCPHAVVWPFRDFSRLEGFVFSLLFSKPHSHLSIWWTSIHPETCLVILRFQKVRTWWFIPNNAIRQVLFECHFIKKLSHGEAVRFLQSHMVRTGSRHTSI